MERSAVVGWLDAYVHAWETYSPEAIVASWLKDPDPPGMYEGSYEPIAVDGDVAVVQGRSRYFRDSARTEPTKEWDNIFVIRFDEAGLCRSFSEWYVARRGQTED